MTLVQQTSGTLYNALTCSSKIVGSVTADSDIRVDGTIEGDLDCSSKLVIGEHGYVKGNIKCQNAEIMGKIDGSISVTYALALRATGRINGDIIAQTLIVEPNALLNGFCKMREHKAEEKKQTV